MMTQSILYDQDLKYEKKDLDRALKTPFCDVPAGLYLTPTKNGHVYSKPFLYPIFCAPFYLILKEKGIILFNFFLFSLIILMGYLYLKQKNDNYSSFLFSFLFFFLSSSFVYIFWMNPEIFTMFLMTLAIFLWFSPKPKFYITSLAFALLAIIKPVTIVFFITFILWAIQDSIPTRKILVSVFIFLCLFFSFSIYNYSLTGEVYCYFGTRSYFPGIPDLPFYKGVSDISGRGKSALFSSQTIPISAQGLFHISLRRIAILGMTIYYFLFGRFTGILLYYVPLLGGLYLYDKTDRRKNMLIAATLFYVMIHLVFRYFSYFGGGHVIGNRYFLIVFPAFLFIIDRIKFNYITNTIFLVAFICNLPFMIAPNFNSESPFTHTLLPPYRFFPVEKHMLTNLPFYKYAFKLRTKPFLIDTFENRTKQFYMGPEEVYGIYFLNGQLYQRKDGFYVAHGDTCQLFLRISRTDKKSISFLVKNFSKETRLIEIRIYNRKRSLSLFPGAVTSVEIPLTEAKPFALHIEKLARTYEMDIKIDGTESDNLTVKTASSFKEMVFFEWPKVHE